VLTLFAIPKSFEGHIGIIQRNAITSWTLLRPQCEIILFGDDEGTGDVARELGVRHVPRVARNEWGTPLLNDIFEKAQKLATHDLCCFVNSDIIFMNDFMEAAQRLAAWKDCFLMAGRRWDLRVNDPLDFGLDWREKLRMQVARHGQLHSPAGIDYFLFKRGLWEDIPPFAIGRPAYDNWLLYHARSRGISLVDATRAVMAVHQNHDYPSHLQRERGVRWKSPEAKRNVELAGGRLRFLTVMNATHVLTPAGPKWALDWRHLWSRIASLPVFYRHLGLPIRLLFIARDLSRPIRLRLGLTLSERGYRHG
jgi:hypothetical protein